MNALVGIADEYTDTCTGQRLQQTDVHRKRSENGKIVQAGSRLPQRPVNDLPIGVRLRRESSVLRKHVQGIGLTALRGCVPTSRRKRDY